MKQIFVLLSILFVNGIASSQIDKKAVRQLAKTKKAIENVHSAQYIYKDYFLFPGQLVPDDEDINQTFIKEQVNDIDTIIGAKFFHFDVKNKGELLWAYDGNIKVKLNREEKTYKMIDYRGEPWYKRKLMAPFFTRSLAVIDYALNTDNTVSIESITEGKNLKYTITILDKEIEFVGKISDDISRFTTGGNSVYDLWIDAETLLPYKLSRTLSANTIVEQVSEVEINNVSHKEFIIENTIPNDFYLRHSINKGANNIIGTKAKNIKLGSGKGEFCDLMHLKNEIIVLQFTSNYCGPCRLSKPFLEELQQKYPDNEVKVIALYSHKEKKKQIDLNKGKQAYDISYITTEAFKAYNVELVPTFVILDKEKTVRKVIKGYLPLKSDAVMFDAVEEVLKILDRKECDKRVHH